MLPAREAQGDAMNIVRLIGLGFLILGVLGLVYGDFTYTKETQRKKLGPLEFEVKDRERVHVPIWAGIGAVVVGGVLIVAGKKR